MLLNKIIFKARDKDGQEVPIETDGTIILVGPNNAGKSLALREIERYLDDGNSSINKVVSGIEIESVDNEDRAYEILKGSEVVMSGGNLPENSFFIGKTNYSNGNKQHFFTFTKGDQQAVEFLNRTEVKRKIAYTYVLRLDGTTRLTSLNQSNATDLLNYPVDLNSMILLDSVKRQEIRKIIYEAFGLYMATDVTGRSVNRIRFDETSPTESIETGVGDDAISYHSRATKYEEVGDGLKAFSGIVANIIISKSKIILIDEPEAFLHPPLAYKLGEEISKIAQSRKVNLIVATHSSSFLMEIIQSGAKVNIARLTYSRGIAGIKIIDSEEVKKLISNPVMRSANVLSALFHEGAIVTEDDSDRVLYQEINYRLVKHRNTGLNGALFLNSNGKSALHKIVGPLRKTGVPAAICADFDLFFEAADFGAVLIAANVPNALCETFKVQKSSLLNTNEGKNRAGAKSQGINNFTGENHKVAIDLVNRLAEYGIFIIPNGELESWLKYLNISGQKVGRVIKILERFGNDASSVDYVMPTNEDVWQYIESVTSWIKNPNRNGM